MTFETGTIRRGLAFAGAIAAGLALGAPAHAGSCPADKLRPDGSGEKMNTTAAKGVTDNVLAAIDLANEPASVKDRQLRLRRLEIKPGGVVPIVHHAGDVAAETHATAHWWKNTGKETVVLVSADLFPVTAPDPHMM